MLMLGCHHGHLVQAITRGGNKKKPRHHHHHHHHHDHQNYLPDFLWEAMAGGWEDVEDMWVYGDGGGGGDWAGGGGGRTGGSGGVIDLCGDDDDDEVGQLVLTATTVDTTISTTTTTDTATTIENTSTMSSSAVVIHSSTDAITGIGSDGTGGSDGNVVSIDVSAGESIDARATRERGGHLRDGVTSPASPLPPTTIRSRSSTPIIVSAPSYSATLAPASTSAPATDQHNHNSNNIQQESGQLFVAF